MKKFLAIAICSLPFALAPAAYAQTTDSAAMTASESDWSVKDGIIGKSVYNENDDKVGDVTDVIVAPDGKITSFVVGAGGFLGLGEHNVAIPFDKITKADDKLMLAGYTKDQLKELPAYKAPRRERPMTTPGATDAPATSPGTLGAPPAPGADIPPGAGTTPGTTTPGATTKQ